MPAPEQGQHSVKCYSSWGYLGTGCETPRGRGYLTAMQTLTSVYFYSSAGLVLLIFIAAVVQKFRQPNDFIRALAGYRLVPDGALRFWWLLPWQSSWQR